jgi:hypothetical protein
MRLFRVTDNPFRLWAPPWLQAAATPPLQVRSDIWGRVELVIGRLGAGKTTWASLRAKHLAKGSGCFVPGKPAEVDHPGYPYGWAYPEGTGPEDRHDRALATTGQGWPEPWVTVSSWSDLFSLRDCVVVVDEIHLLAPSTKGLLTPDVERRFISWLSKCRKRGVCVLGTTQAWTRVATHYRQLVGTVWLCEPVKPGRLHRATAHYPPDEGGTEAWSPQWFRPARAQIPTNASVWVPYDLGEDDDVSAGHGAAAQPPPVPALPSWPAGLVEWDGRPPGASAFVSR